MPQKAALPGRGPQAAGSQPETFKRGRQTGGEAGARAQQDGGHEEARVECEHPVEGKRGGHQRPGARQQPRAGERAAGGSDERQHDALCQHHAVEAQAPRSERRADGHFARLRRGARQQQAGHVRRCDEQQADHRAGHGEESRARLLPHLLKQRLDLQVVVFVRGGESFGEAQVQRVEAPLRLLGAYVGAEPRQAIVRARAARLGGGRERDPDHDFVLLVGQKSPASHAHHRMNLAVQRDGLACDVRAGSEAPLPQRVADHRHAILARKEAAAGRHGVVEHAEVIGGDGEAAQDLRAVEARQALSRPTELRVPGEGGGFEQARLLPVVQKIGAAHALAPAEVAKAFKADDAVRGAVGRGRQQDIMRHGEDGGACADAQGQHARGQHGRAGIAADAPRRFAKVVTEGGQGHGNTNALFIY